MAKQGTFGKVGARPFLPQPIKLEQATTALSTELARGVKRKDIKVPWFGCYPYKMFVVRDDVSYEDLLKWCQDNFRLEVHGQWRLDACWVRIDASGQKRQIADVVYVQTKEAASLLKLFFNDVEIGDVLEQHFTERSRKRLVKRPSKIAPQFNRSDAAKKAWEGMKERVASDPAYAAMLADSKKLVGRMNNDEVVFEHEAALNGQQLPPNWLAEKRRKERLGEAEVATQAPAEPEQLDLVRTIAEHEIKAPKAARKNQREGA